MRTAPSPTLMSRVASAILALLAFVALLIVQFNLPWAHREDESGFASAEITVRTWDLEATGSAFGFTGTDTKGWYDGGWDDEQENAVTQMQIAAPLLVAASVLLLVGAVLSFTRGPGSLVALVGGVLAAAATLLYFLASQDLLDNGATWLAGFYLGLAGTILGLAGGVVGLAVGNMRGSAS
jgi:lipopolysaccharide export LptBFGC system permease protein LptF